MEAQLLELSWMNSRNRNETIHLIQADSSQEQQSRANLKNRLRNRYNLFKEWLNINRQRVYLFFVIAFMLESLCTYSYYERNLKCKSASQLECVQDGLRLQVKKLHIYLIFLATDCFIFLFYLYSFTKRKTYRWVIFLGIIQQIWLFYLGEYSLTVFDMMGMVQVVHTFFILLFLLIFAIIVLLRHCWKKSRKFTVGGIIITTLLILYFLVDINQCQSVKQGINGVIQPKEGTCNIPLPFCTYLIFISHLDLNLIAHNCFLGDKYKQIFNNHFSYDIANGTILGFSDLKNASQKQRSHGHLATTVFKSARRYKTMGQAREAEHEIIFDSVDQRYYIQVLANKTLKEEKDKIWAKSISSLSPPLAKNVLLIFLDSVSRYEAHLKLPKFIDWFKKKSKYQSYKNEQPKREQISSQGAQAYEFYKYHSIGYYSQHNIFPMFYGKTLPDIATESSKLNKRGQTLHKDYNQRGYVTGFSSSFCASYGADIYDSHLRHLKNPIADHQAFAFNCDPNFHQPYFQFGFTKGNSASTDRCLYHKTQSQYAFQYITSFFDKYKDSSKFAQINLIEGHDYFGGSVRYLDSAMVQFLQNLQKQGHLQDTLVLAVSDHGQHQIARLQSIDSDHFHPFLFLSVPQKMNTKYRHKIRLNQQNLITAYSVYNFLMQVAIGEDYENESKGLLGDLSNQTDCTSANIPSNWGSEPACFCK